MLGAKKGNEMNIASTLEDPDTWTDEQAFAVFHAQDEAKATYAERVHTAQNTYPLPKFKTSRLLPTQFFHSSLFRVADKRIPREEVTVAFLPLTSGGYIEFVGEELRQDDESVLLELTYRLAGHGRLFDIAFDPVEFVQALGWDDSTVVTNEKKERALYSVHRLKACIERMRGTGLRLFDVEGELRWSTGLVQEAFYLARWKVQMSGTLLDLLVERATAINVRIRRKLSEGLGTWLYGFICANDCTRAFSLKALLAASGSSASLPEFGRAVRAALFNIKTEGGLKDFQPSRGRVVVIKKVRLARRK